MLKHLLLACAAAGLLAGGVTTQAATQADKKAEAKAGKKSAKATDKAAKKSAKKADGPLVVAVKPPSGQWEGKPPPAEGWVWRAGYYNWNGERFVWTPGEWILDKPGMDFRQYSWEEAGEGKWKLTGGDWVAEKST